jgi:hypothetical protein
MFVFVGNRENLIGIKELLHYHCVTKRLVHGSYRRLRETSKSGSRPKGNLCTLSDRYVLVNITYHLHNQSSQAV